MVSIVGCQKFINEILTWEDKAELRTEVLHDLKEIGNALYWISLLDIALVGPPSYYFFLCLYLLLILFCVLILL